MKCLPSRSRCILWLEWEGFYIDEAQKAPSIVVRNKAVLDVNRAARKCGIKVGMTSDEARNIVPDLKRSFWREEIYRDRQHAWLDLCVPFSGRIEPIDRYS